MKKWSELKQELNDDLDRLTVVQGFIAGMLFMLILIGLISYSVPTENLPAHKSGYKSGYESGYADGFADRLKVNQKMYGECYDYCRGLLIKK